MATVAAESFLQAESNHDASRDLLGDGYQGTMNYAAFTRPLWQWLIPPQQRPYAHGKYPTLPNLPGPAVVAAIRELSGVTPWQGTLHAMNLIGSHDTHRERWDQARLSNTQALFQARAASIALQRGGLRWLHIGDDVLSFVREAPGESVLVHAARANHAAVRIPAVVIGAELTGLAGTPNLRAGADGWVTLPAHGPAFGMWRLAGA